MNNKLKEFEELLLDNTLLKVQNQALGNKNPKWKEWWQIVQEFTKEQIQESMELAHSDEQNYQPELHAYQTTFLDFKYEPPNFVYVEIGTNNKVPTMPCMVQPIAITKPISPLKRWNRFKDHTLTCSDFYHTYSSCHVINEPMKGSEKFAKE
jgi:hypothetical protein